MQWIAYTHHEFNSIAINLSGLDNELYALVFSLQRLDYHVRLKHFMAETYPRKDVCETQALYSGDGSQ